MKFNQKADNYLQNLYQSVGAITPEQKYNTLILKLGYQDDTINFYARGEATWEQKQGCLEYDLLEREGLIKLVLA